MLSVSFVFHHLIKRDHVLNLRSVMAKPGALAWVEAVS